MTVTAVDLQGLSASALIQEGLHDGWARCYRAILLLALNDVCVGRRIMMFL